MPIIREVKDRKLPPNADPECKRSQAQGSTGIGHNAKSYREDQEDFNKGVDTTGTETAHTLRDAQEDSGAGTGKLPAFLSRRGY
jgi:hypothetical protein